MYKTSKKTIEDIQYIDKMKDILAQEHGYNMIRIDCSKSEMLFIRNNILLSELNSLFDLSNINWEICHHDALSSKIKEACDYWNENLSINDIKEKFKKSRSTIQAWLRKGSLIGLCDYSLQRKPIT